jgi:hypothetical protein
MALTDRLLAARLSDRGSVTASGRAANPATGTGRLLLAWGQVYKHHGGEDADIRLSDSTQDSETRMTTVTCDLPLAHAAPYQPQRDPS